MSPGVCFGIRMTLHDEESFSTETRELREGETDVPLRERKKKKTPTSLQNCAFFIHLRGRGMDVLKGL